MSKVFLTKTRAMSGRQCARKVWLEINEPFRPELKASEFETFLFNRGRSIESLAKKTKYLPEGVTINKNKNLQVMVNDTQKYMKKGWKYIYEASFFADGVFVALDCLEMHDDGSVTIHEIKSSSELQLEYIDDVAIQEYVVSKSGLNVKEVYVYTLDKNNSNFDDSIPLLEQNVDLLFKRENVKAHFMSHESTQEWLDSLKVVIAEKEMPEMITGKQCSNPTPCPFLEFCESREPKHRTKEFYILHGKKAMALAEAGIDLIEEITPDQVRELKLTDIQTRQWQTVYNNTPYINENTLREDLKQIKFPAAFLDFETVMMAIPCWTNMKFWSNAPMQFSNHVVTKSAKTGNFIYRHREYLSKPKFENNVAVDFRREFAENLIESCEGVESVVVYCKAFENGRMNELAQLFPDLREKIETIISKVVDLLPIVRNNYYHIDFKGSFSIKKVLPALVPGLTYKGMVIPNGEEAMAVAYNLLFCKNFYSPEEEERYRFEMLKYCALDTLAMVKIYEALLALVNGGHALSSGRKD